MPLTIESLRTYQWAKETTKGTIVPATSKIAVQKLEFEELDEIFRPELAHALVVRNSGQETVIKRGTKFSCKDEPVVFDQIHAWCGMAIAGGVSPTGVGPYVWTFTRDITTTPTFDTRSFERRLSGNAANVDEKWGYGFLEKIGLDFKADKELVFSAEGQARRVQAATLTAAQSMPTNLVIPAACLGEVFIDTAWAGLGGTQITGQVLEASWEFTTGLLPKMTLDGRTDLDFTTHIFNHKDVQMKLELKMLLDSAQFATEKAAAEAASLRAVRLKLTSATTDIIQVDGLYKYEKGSLFKVGEEEGQDIITATMQEATDGTNLVSAIITNQAATMI